MNGAYNIAGLTVVAEAILYGWKLSLVKTVANTVDNYHVTRERFHVKWCESFHPQKFPYGISNLRTTVEPPNKGQVGAWALVHYSGVVLYWGVFVKKPCLCVELYILLVYKLLWSVLEQQ